MFGTVVLGLGGFHMLMSYKGCIGQTMAESGMKDVLCLIFAPNSVDKMLASQAFSRVVREHLIVQGPSLNPPVPPQKPLSVSYRIHLQWIPSHVNIQGNEIADALAKAGADDASVPSAHLTYLELFSRAKSRNKTIWLIPPVHHWYQGSRRGGVYQLTAADATNQLLLASLVDISEV
ncbi:hypothetical protein AVEN_156865-1 [Araneus ventricosus]|uniref:RNase H type-1 domain-containing protein n=1 Tax=Araneus ventricosus TaxID=182803 RepID=A0A4Y2UPJ0_ARAVE|nr:hypothetical protein AVEN_156865-1 [Araneus ventricosus]